MDHNHNRNAARILVRGIRHRLPRAMLRERGLALQVLNDLRRGSGSPDRDSDSVLRRLRILDRRLAESAREKDRRERNRPSVRFPVELPITEKRSEIIEAIRAHQVVIVSGETGCGKSTQLPKLCLEAGRGISGKIACTQPRRIAAVTIARRIAEEMGESLGRSVGYKIRFHDRTPPEAYIKIMTDGMLLAETQGDPRLEEYDTLIIDEAHERSLNIDFLLGIARKLLQNRPELKVVITSATLDIEKFRDAFPGAPVIEVSGRMYPVDVEYRPETARESDPADIDYVEAAVKAAGSLIREKSPGDILVFMPTEQDILETCRILEGRKFRGTTVLPLYARLPSAAQARVYSVKGRKIVVATNVAETSLTIPGIKYVIDTGLARISRYLPATRTNSLPIRPISRSSADQRMGRCGRVQKGLCLRLYSQEEYEGRARHTPPEILRANLAEVILRMTALRLEHPSVFPFIDRPPAKSIKDGYETLMELSALKRRGREYLLTERGRKMARMPLDPRISRMLLEAHAEGRMAEVSVIASALSIRDPRERPLEKSDQADRMHRPFHHPDSDFLSLLNIWNRFHGDWEKLTSQNQKRRFCREHFLSYPRMREWASLHQQILSILKELKIPPGGAPFEDIPEAHYAGIHRAVLSGYLSNIAVHKEKELYQAARGREIVIFPGSTLFKKRPAWLVAAEVVKTSRLFARTVARIDPSWLEELGGDLCRRSYSEPRWDSDRGEVRARERVTLFGLEIITGRDVSYGRIDPMESHRIFVRFALVEGHTAEPPGFLRHNLDLHRRLREMEEKMRRRDLLVGEDVLDEFYSGRLPGIRDLRSLESLIKKRGGDDFLKMRESDLLLTRPDRGELDRYPDRLAIGDQDFRAVYRFAPGEKEDGVTLKIPSALLSDIPEGPLEWGLPAQFKDKLTALIKGLPKRHRRRLVPVSETVEILLRELEPDDPSLFRTLSDFAKKRFQVDIPYKIWAEVELPHHLRLRISVTDADGRELAAGRDLKSLKQTGAPALEPGDSPLWRETRERWERKGITDWDFGPLPESVRAGPYLVAYPGLQASDDQIDLRLFASRKEARSAHRKGVEALLLRRFSKDLEFQRRYLALPEEAESALLFFGGRKAVEDALLNGLRRDVFRRDIRDREEFESCAANVIRALSEKGHDLKEAALRVFEAYRRTRTALSEVEATSIGNRIVAAVCTRLREELDDLVPKNFLELYPPDRLKHLPRYLAAKRRRAERIHLDPEKDRERAERVETYLAALEERRAGLGVQSDPKAAGAVNELRWMIEEFRVSLFAPELKTAFPISVKRLLEKQKEIDRLI